MGHVESAEPAPELTILMPCLDEARTIGACIEKARRFLERTGIDGEIVIADNGSSDGSQAIARSLGARVVPVATRGYGAALLGGIDAARGTYVIMGDCDESYDFEHLDAFVERLRAGDALVMGNRFKGGIDEGAMPLLHYYLGNPVLSALGRLFFGGPVRDFHCGLRGFRLDDIRRLELRMTGMEFASEMVVRALLSGLRVSEVPTRLAKDGRDRAPHLRTWRDGWRHLRFLLLLSPRWLFLLPGAALATVGMAALLWLWPGTRYVGSVGFDIGTMLYAGGASVVGVEAVLLSLLARSFAANVGLLPPHRRVHAFSHPWFLEASLVLGVLAVLAGLALSGWALFDWGQTGFQRLDPQVSLRRMIPAIVVALIGSQVLLFGLFGSILQLQGSGRGAGASRGADPR